MDKRIRYQYPFKGIFLDMDSTLTGLGANSWATAFWQHNAAQPECTTDMALYDGLICDPSVQVRRIVMYGASPGSLKDRDLFVLPYDNSLVNGMTEQELLDYEADELNYSKVEFRKKRNPSDHWAVPFVTGKTYYVRWAFGLDFEKMNFSIVPWLWDASDLDVQFKMPHYDVREAVYVDNNLGERIENNTIVTNAPNYSFGDNQIQN